MDQFEIHDVSRFPVVTTRPGAARPGYAPQWEREMDALLRRGLPFVILMPDPPQGEEAHEDRRLRGMWLKRNRDTLAALCRAVITVEPDAVRRAAFKVQAAIAVKAFGVAMEVAATGEEAANLATALLAA
ncbi:hypothetical protein FBZ89_103345 [Nitrospirillum amazonense]|uniref:Uncharacterized protein n=1 Tax=Nitrospirillum amazonense TaxID=28077 RepID=A0A560FM73_9PROT|nr:hypothetical protein [Nitrospirillum amazonense]TWB22718.1 hypothetical protein FBZ89_103345 [Nitrospirillum amazonense]